LIVHGEHEHVIEYIETQNSDYSLVKKASGGVYTYEMTLSGIALDGEFYLTVQGIMDEPFQLLGEIERGTGDFNLPSDLSALVLTKFDILTHPSYGIKFTFKGVPDDAFPPADDAFILAFFSSFKPLIKIYDITGATPIGTALTVNGNLTVTGTINGGSGSGSGGSSDLPFVSCTDTATIIDSPLTIKGDLSGTMGSQPDYSAFSGFGSSEDTVYFEMSSFKPILISDTSMTTPYTPQQSESSPEYELNFTELGFTSFHFEVWNSNTQVYIVFSGGTYRVPSNYWEAEFMSNFCGRMKIFGAGVKFSSPVAIGDYRIYQDGFDLRIDEGINPVMKILKNSSSYILMVNGIIAENAVI
jgi:hypothetical protein